MYYLNSRYYNQEWGRFINADGIIGVNQDTISNNLYIYASNNPINISDYNGNWNICSNLKNIAKSISKGIKKVLNSVFGYESIVTTETVNSKSVGFVNTITVGKKTTTIISKSGDSSKPISLQINKVANNLSASSANLKINVFNTTVKLSLSLAESSLNYETNISKNISSFNIGISGVNLFTGLTSESNYDNVNGGLYIRNNSNFSIPIAVAYGIATGNVSVQNLFPSFGF